MSNPEVLPNLPETRPELTPDESLCLYALTEEAQRRVRRGESPESVIGALDGTNIEADEEMGMYFTSCPHPTCESACIVTILTRGDKTKIQIEDPEDSLDKCVEDPVN